MKIVIDCINCKDAKVVETIVCALEQHADIAWRMDVTREAATTSWYSNISIDTPPSPKVE